MSNRRLEIITSSSWSLIDRGRQLLACRQHDHLCSCQRRVHDRSGSVNGTVMERTQTVVPSLSGVAAQDCLKAIQEIVGADTYATAHERIAPHVRQEIDTMSAVSWVPIEAFNAFVDEIARTARIDPDAMLDKAIRLAVQRTFTTVWRVLLRVTSDDALIKRTPMIYARGRNVGSLSARLVEPGHGELSLTGWPDLSDRTLRTIGVGIQCVVELAGRRDVRMAYSRTPEGGRYRLSWKL